jgi:hypothetical protein
MPMPAAAHSPATAQRRQRPASPVIARAEPGRSHPSALIHYTAEAISHATPHPQATPPYRCPTPHRSQIPIGRVPHPPAVSSLGGFRTPAARASGEVRACGWPASENLHISGHVGNSVPDEPSEKSYIIRRQLPLCFIVQLPMCIIVLPKNGDVPKSPFPPRRQH